MVDDEVFVLQRKEDEGLYQKGRNGDHLIVAFQCDLCNFRNIQHRDPTGSAEDRKLLVTVRRATLDAFWSRAPRTVARNLTDIRGFRRHGVSMGISDPYGGPQGPWPFKDLYGVGFVCMMLSRSLDPEKHAETIQYSTM